MSIKKVAITGVAGLIGSNLAEQLLDRGYSISGIDNFSIGRRRNIDNLFKYPGFNFFQLDVLDEARLKEVCRDCSVIIHLAAYKIPVGKLTRSDVLKVNSLSTLNVLNVASELGAKVLFASSSDVYGKSTDLPLRENGDLVLGPTKIERWSYAASKIFDEHLCLSYHHERGVPVVILRYFNSYGPHHDLSIISGGPHAIFMEAILDNKPITIFGDGLQRRAFCYVSDTVDGTILAMENEKAIGEIFNLGNDETYISLIELANTIIEICGAKDAKVEFIPYEATFGNFEEIFKRIPDLTKARRILGYKPKVGIVEGIKKTWEWHLSLRK